MAIYNNSILKINEEIARALPYSGLVIDLGCGTAPYKSFILDKADRYIGVDWGQSLHSDSEVDVVADLCETLPFEDDYADTVCSFQVVEHLREPDFFISECFRILKPGGSLFLTSPFMWQVHEAPFDFFRYTRFGLEHLLKKNGFTKLQVEATTGYWHTSALKFNYHSLRYSRGILRYFWIPIWFLNQPFAAMIDKIDFDPTETASYKTTAVKPG